MPTKRTELHTIGEFGLIARIRTLVDFHVDDATLHENLVRGVADDAAVYRPTPGKVQIFTTDAMVEGVHFDLTFQSVKHLGWKAMVCNISDVAAMGGVPRYAAVVLSLPQKMSVEMVEEFYEGAVFACKKYSCLIVGGDTTASSGNMMVTVAMTGEADGAKVVYRSGAEPGDLICVTGHLGAAHAGLSILLREKERFVKAPDPEAFEPNLEPYKFALKRYLMPEPRLDMSRLLVDNVKIHAMIDVSDGAASEVRHVCESSNVGAEVWEHNLPVEGVTQLIARELSKSATELALYGGEEYELLFTLSDKEFAKLERLTNDVTVIGRIVDLQRGVELVRESGERQPLPVGGWDHFRK
jgi:thiamine-monophosphate kinase